MVSPPGVGPGRGDDALRQLLELDVDVLHVDFRVELVEHALPDVEDGLLAIGIEVVPDVEAARGIRDRGGGRRPLSELVFESYRFAGLSSTVQFLDRLKEFGFRYATMGGVSIGIEDLEIPAEKAELLTEALELGGGGGADLREVVVVAEMDHTIGSGRAGAQAVEVLQIAAQGPACCAAIWMRGERQSG